MPRFSPELPLLVTVAALPFSQVLTVCAAATSSLSRVPTASDCHHIPSPPISNGQTDWGWDKVRLDYYYYVVGYSFHDGKFSWSLSLFCQATTLGAWVPDFGVHPFVVGIAAL